MFLEYVIFISICSIFAGSPVKAEDTPGAVRLNMADPRPAHLRNVPGYNDFVRNMVINYCSDTSHDLSMKYLYPKANLQAAAWDHAYVERPMTEYWVDKALQVTY